MVRKRGPTSTGTSNGILIMFVLVGILLLSLLVNTYFNSVAIIKIPTTSFAHTLQHASYVGVGVTATPTGAAGGAAGVSARDVQVNVQVPYGRVAEANNQCGEYKQIGILVGKDDDQVPPTILPLFGRSMAHRRDRYEYYTATDKEHLWKVPVQFEKRDCQTEIGCAEIYNGDDVVVPDYANKTFRARIYENTVMPRCQASTLSRIAI